MRQRGFTLIEVLFSVSLLILLGTIIYASLAFAKDQAYAAKAKSDAALIKNSIDLYYRNTGNWPPSANYGVYSTATGGNWSTFVSGLAIGTTKPITPPFESIAIDNDPILTYQGYVYYRSSQTHGGVFALVDFDTDTCLLFSEGYYLDMRLPEQTSASINDGGIDPWGIEYFDGQFQFVSASSC
ncbi:type II secretion system GspH family protein [Candidatus Parcubacteria bacterium]|nr:type II secretion system GspH family protein [Candidatus Parcubacteria bacterium]